MPTVSEPIEYEYAGRCRADRTVTATRFDTEEQMRDWLKPLPGGWDVVRRPKVGEWEVIPEPRTIDERFAFERAWDARVKAAKRS